MSATYSHADLARLCQEAYLDNLDTPCVEIGGRGPRARVYGSDNPDRAAPAIIIFRGTADIEGWIEDVRCDRVPMGLPHPTHTAGEVHTGFYLDWQSIRSQVRRAVGSRTVIIAGHSLGGALATLAAVEMHEQVEEVVTFGSPRVGDAAFVDAYDQLIMSHTSRYVNDLDPVPWVPLWCAGFRHVTPATWHNGQEWGPWTWGGMARAMLAWIRGNWKTTFFAHHGIEQYVAALEHAEGVRYELV